MKLPRKFILYILALAVFVSAVAVIGSVYAKYITDISGKGEILFTPPVLIAEVSAPVVDAVEKTSIYTVSSSNSSTMPSFIRCAVVVNWIDSKNNIWAVPPTEGTDYSISYSDTQVQKLGDYYYYLGAIAPEYNFPIIVKQLQDKVGYTLHVQILAESIQSVPNTAVQTAWGVIYDGNTWSTVPTSP